MKFKYKNRKKRALFLSISSIKTYLQRIQVFASTIHSTFFETNICRRHSFWADQREELWFDMLKDQNFELHWGSDFRMSQGTFRDIVTFVQPALEKTDTQFWRVIPTEKQVAIALWRLLICNCFWYYCKNNCSR